MLILVLNSGSSSVKYKLYNMQNEECIAWGIVERIGMRGSVLRYSRNDGHNVTLAGDIFEHTQAIEYIMAILLSPNHGVIKDKNDIVAVGHRIVHGGEKFTKSVIIDAEVMKIMRDCIELAPLHNPHNIKGVTACQTLLPDKPQIAVFDTAFHQTMPDYSYLYPLPYVIYKRYALRRYGFHGTSHLFVADRASKLIGKKIEELRLITCHLGNGCSITAVDKGKSVDTSMGFTPVEGLMMGTRTGDFDPAALLYIISKEELGMAEANSLINKHSGLLGISGISNDMREIEMESKSGNVRAELALQMFCYRALKYIGAYAAVMGGVDGIVFTGGIGENSSEVRSRICKNLTYLNAELDVNKNAEKNQNERFIDTGSKARIMVIPTNEELVIARDTLELVMQ